MPGTIRGRRLFGRPGRPLSLPGVAARRFAWLMASLTAVAAISSVPNRPVAGASGSPGQPTKSGDHPKFSVRAARLAASGGAAPKPSAEARNNSVGLNPSGPGSLLLDGDGTPVFYVRLTAISEANLQALRDRGARILHTAPSYRQVTIAIDPSQLRSLGDLASVEFVMEALAPAASGLSRLSLGQVACNATVSEGDTQLRAAAARSTFGVAGAGATVGVLSDSFDRWGAAATHAADDVVSDDLPGASNPCGHTAPVQVLDDSASTLNPLFDEGRAMLQIVHDLAPEARLQFATAFKGVFAMADSISALRQAGSKVIVDDVAYFAEPFFQEGPVNMAISAARAAGVTYLSAAGNQNLLDAGREFNGYEAPAYRPTTCPAGIPVGQTNCHNFRSSGSPDPTYRFSLAPGQSVSVDLQWAEPWNGVTTDVDVFLLEGSTVVASSEDENVAGTRIPFEFLTFQNTSTSARNLDLVVGRFSANGTPRLKFVFLARGGVMSGVEYAVPVAPDAVTGTIFGHSGARDGLSVAAARYDDNANPESFSSRGPVVLYFGPANGFTAAAPLSAPELLAKPNVTATDGGRTTFFFPPPPPGPTYRFFGTSAAAPHAAAVAALIVSRFPTITPTSLGAVLASTARPMPGGTSRSVGSGLIDAVAALGAIGVAPPGYNGRIDAVRAVGDRESYRLMEEISNIYNRSRGCPLDRENLSVCAASQP